MDPLSLLILPFFLGFVLITLARCMHSIMEVALKYKIHEDETPKLVFTEAHSTILIPVLSFIKLCYLEWNLPYVNTYSLPFYFLFFISITCFWVSKFYRTGFSLSARMIVRLGTISGIIICLAFSAYLIILIHKKIYFPFAVIELATSVANIFLLSREVYFNYLSYNQHKILNYASRQ